MAEIEVTISDEGPQIEASVENNVFNVNVTVEGAGPPGPQGPPGKGLPEITEDDEGKALVVTNGVAEWSEIEGGGVDFEVGNGLKMENKILSVNMAEGIEQDNTLPVSSATVFVTVGNIEALLGTI